MSLQVLVSNGLLTVQDIGRRGWERFGVPVGGAMDGFALRAANRLTGNPPEAAGLEAALGEVQLLAGQDLLLAAAGRGWQLRVEGRPLPLWMAEVARRGELIKLLPEDTPGWCCLAFSGGIQTQLILGSRSTCLAGGFGGLEGRALRPGDHLPVGSHAPLHAPMLKAGVSLPLAARPAYADDLLLDLVPGPQADHFTAAAWQTLLTSSYRLTPACSRMGYRLAGPRLEHCSAADILSEGTPPGSVQVPGDGQPVILMADRQATGGYAKIGVVSTADLPLLAQCPPGAGSVRFAVTTPAQAAKRWREMLAGLEKQ